MKTLALIVTLLCSTAAAADPGPPTDPSIVEAYQDGRRASRMGTRMMVGGDLMMYSGAGLAIAGLYGAHSLSLPPVAALTLGGAGVFGVGIVRGRRGFMQSEEALAALGASSGSRRWVWIGSVIYPFTFLAPPITLRVQRTRQERAWQEAYSAHQKTDPQKSGRPSFSATAAP